MWNISFEKKMGLVMEKTILNWVSDLNFFRSETWESVQEMFSPCMWSLTQKGFLGFIFSEFGNPYAVIGLCLELTMEWVPYGVATEAVWKRRGSKRRDKANWHEFRDFGGQFLRPDLWIATQTHYSLILRHHQSIRTCTCRTWKHLLDVAEFFLDGILAKAHVKMTE